MSGMTKHEVVIAGGGPTGLMLAAELALAKVDVAVVERRPESAFYLLPARAWELGTGALLALGAGPPVRRRATLEVTGLLGAAAVVAGASGLLSSLYVPEPRRRLGWADQGAAKLVDRLEPSRIVRGYRFSSLGGFSERIA